MERRWVEALLRPEEPAVFDDLLPQSIAARSPHPIYMLAVDIYALTHVPMFVTGFGVHRPPASFDVSEISGALDASISWALFSDNFDLLAELVLAAEFLNLPRSPYQRLAWATLELAWSELGLLTAPSFELAKFGEVPLGDRPAYAFRHVYHTTYVAGMLYASLLRPGREGRCASARTAEIGDALLNALEAGVRRAAEFRSRFQSVAPSSGVSARGEAMPLTPSDSGLSDCVMALVDSWLERDTRATRTPLRAMEKAALDDADLVCVLADGLLTWTARDYDLAMLAHALEVCARIGVPTTPTMVTVTEFLLGQQVASGAIGAWFVNPSHGRSAQAADVTGGLARALVSVYQRTRDT